MQPPKRISQLFQAILRVQGLRVSRSLGFRGEGLEFGVKMQNGNGK